MIDYDNENYRMERFRKQVEAENQKVMRKKSSWKTTVITNLVFCGICFSIIAFVVIWVVMQVQQMKQEEESKPEPSYYIISVHGFYGEVERQIIADELSYTQAGYIKYHDIETGKVDYICHTKSVSVEEVFEEELDEKIQSERELQDAEVSAAG